jgi:predicted RNA-binding protein with PIN domain
VSEHFLIVDGHSIIFSWPELLALHQRNTAVARDSLVKTLTAYQDVSGNRAGFRSFIQTPDEQPMKSSSVWLRNTPKSSRSL